ncbi:Targeting protein for Xklp2 [Frankliniella fusca]|uniref:Targeting protein for Xklp2 n=1 Tax=Frankliniella fusca TaxID=407009 RepID=A0AAE1HAE1_9NEOP|nr:Targeting protein for Xklp2 [Frankliniella fusca]
MSMYDNFRAPQYVDFLNLHNQDIGADNASAFFNSNLEMDSKFGENSHMSSNSEMSVDEKTLTPTSCLSNSTLTANVTTSSETALSSMDVSQQTSSYCDSHQFAITPTPSACNNSKGQSKKIVLSSKSVDCQQPSEESINYKKATKRGNVSNNKYNSTETSCGRETTPRALNNVLVNVIPPTPTSPGFALETSTPLVSSAVLQKRTNEQASNRKRRSRSVDHAQITPCNDEEILQNALGMLKISGKKTGCASMSESLSQSISPQSVSIHASSEKTKRNSQLEEGSQRGKRKISPSSRLIRDSCRQPEKFISMAEEVARVQRKTPTRYRTLPKSANLRRAVQSKVAKIIRFEHKDPPSSGSGSNNGRGEHKDPPSSGSGSNNGRGEHKDPPSSGSGSNNSRGATGEAEHDKTKSTQAEKGVRIPRWAPAKVEPFKFTENNNLPRKVFNFDRKENLLLRDRKTPFARRIPTTKVEPFSFDNRDKEIIKRKVERLRGVAAANVPCGKPATRQRSKSHTGEMLVGTGEQIFHARKPVVLYKPPFKPKQSDHKPTVPIPVMLSTERRAKEREKFEEHLQQKDEYRSALLRQLKEKQKQEEEKEIQQLRKGLVHKAHPVPNFTHKFKVKPSSAPLTSPHSPAFASKLLQKSNEQFHDPPMEF